MTSPRLMSIGEFAAATQLSSKALRLYDEQRLLPPAHTDTTNGYRFYKSDQVAQGRLIRTLREMGLSLAEISTVIVTTGVPTEVILSRFASEQDLRHAREKRAYHAALTMMRKAASGDLMPVTKLRRDAGIFAVREFVARRHEFVERFRIESQVLTRELDDAGIHVLSATRCALVDPLAEEPGRLEVMVAVSRNDRLDAVHTRSVPATHCATITLRDRTLHSSELASAVDTLFDWFDRRGYQAAGAPLLDIDTEGGDNVVLEWAYRTS